MSNHVNSPRGAVQGLNFVWSAGLLEWVPETQPTGGGGGGTVDQGTGGSSAWKVTIDQTGSGNGIQTYADVLNAAPTAAPTRTILVGGKTDDGTPQYLPIPLSTPASGGSGVKVADDGVYIDYTSDGSNVKIKAFGLVVPSLGGALPVSPSFPLPTRGSGYVYKMDYDGSNNLIYLGITHTGATASDTLWTIRKFTYDGSNNITDITWANGDPELFTYSWDLRATYTYS